MRAIRQNETEAHRDSWTPRSRPTPLWEADALLEWFAAHSRDLPWRGEGASPWRVLVSEFMLQQTPVARVLPLFEAWMCRWPTPAALAAAEPADVLRAWGSLGYPRRALRLRQTAVELRDRWEGRVPDSLEALLALPGVGAYTARAILAFGFARRVPVVDTNIRRVLSRAVRGLEDSPPRERKDLEDVEALLPEEPNRASAVVLGLMELGALVCTSRSPRCGQCPLRVGCAWVDAGSPPGPARRRQSAYEGSDRQVRGRILRVLRERSGPLSQDEIDLLWKDRTQSSRAIDGLLRDGLIEMSETGVYSLPSSRRIGKGIDVESRGSVDAGTASAPK